MSFGVDAARRLRAGELHLQMNGRKPHAGREAEPRRGRERGVREYGERGDIHLTVRVAAVFTGLDRESRAVARDVAPFDAEKIARKMQSGSTVARNGSQYPRANAFCRGLWRHCSLAVYGAGAVQRQGLCGLSDAMTIRRCQASRRS